MTSNPFPSAYDKLYYVYLHRDPITCNLLYVGHGFGDRAWSITNRDVIHKVYLQNLLKEGYLPCDWVELVSMQLTKASAKSDENFICRNQTPTFNKSIRSKILKFTPDVYDIAKNMRDNGQAYSAIAKAVGLSIMSIHRGLTGQTISLELALAAR